jgi:hypothetical protein
MLKPFVWLALLSAISGAAQDAPRSIALTDKSDVPADSISKSLRKECPNVSIVKDAAKSDYTLEALLLVEFPPGYGSMREDTYNLTLFDREGKIVRSTSTSSLGGSVKDLCHAIKAFVMVEVVDTQNLTQSTDTRGDTSGGIIGTVVNSATGRRTHTDTASISVIINGEHALLDCYERATGCSTIGPGKYYGSGKTTGFG